VAARVPSGATLYTGRGSTRNRAREPMSNTALSGQQACLLQHSSEQHCPGAGADIMHVLKCSWWFSYMQALISWISCMLHACLHSWSDVALTVQARSLYTRRVFDAPNHCMATAKA
jgi:hypothetical protein